MNIEQRINEVKGIIARYHQVEKSAELKEYNNLKAIVEGLEFGMARRAALETRFEETPEYSAIKGFAKVFRGLKAWSWNRGRKARWAATEQGKQDLRYNQLAKNADIVFFLAQDAKQIAGWESYKTLLEDELQTAGNWEAGFPVPAKMKAIFSSPKQNAAITGHNHSCADSILTLEVRHEKATSPAWDSKKGFYPAEYAYTGDVMNTANHFTLKKGLILVKVRFSGKADGSIYLSAGYDKRPIVIAQNEGKNTGWQVVSYELDGKEDYCLCAAATLGKDKSATGKVEIDWVRVYSK